MVATGEEMGRALGSQPERGWLDFNRGMSTRGGPVSATGVERRSGGTPNRYWCPDGIWADGLGRIVRSTKLTARLRSDSSRVSQQSADEESLPV